MEGREPKRHGTLSKSKLQRAGSLELEEQGKVSVRRARRTFRRRQLTSLKSIWAACLSDFFSRSLPEAIRLALILFLHDTRNL